MHLRRSRYARDRDFRDDAAKAALSDEASKAITQGAYYNRVVLSMVKALKTKERYVVPPRVSPSDVKRLWAIAYSLRNNPQKLQRHVARVARRQAPAAKSNAPSTADADKWLKENPKPEAKLPTYDPNKPAAIPQGHTVETDSRGATSTSYSASDIAAVNNLIAKQRMEAEAPQIA